MASGSGSVTATALGLSAAPAAPPSFGEAARTWARIGLTNFGGPAGQIAQMHRVLVDEKRWIDETSFLHALNLCMLLPGPEAQQLATYVGWRLHGVRGGLVAGWLFVVPGFLVILALSAAYLAFAGTRTLETLFVGLKAAVLAILLEAVLRIGRRVLKNGTMLAIAAASFVAIFAFKAPFPLIVFAAALLGLVGGRLAPKRFAVLGANDNGSTDEEIPSRSARVASTARMVGIWMLLWFAPLGVLALLLGPDHLFVTLGLYFAKMAVVTFGGAYAVLAYVAQAAVETYHWLVPGEMLDGLALAETTPGPLIIVLCFVGFLAGARNSGFDPMLGGAIGALVTVWMTFAPCFLFIFAAAPWVESLRRQRVLAAALSAITAAVVGVILNLGMWFALHALFGQVDMLRLGPATLPVPFLASFSPTTALLALAAGVALLRFHIGMIPTLAGCALAGVALRAAF
ncbi:MAG: chrA [Rhodospirillales bacterium]|nr:chrA [Rhodospirillales bacterium]